MAKDLRIYCLLPREEMLEILFEPDAMRDQRAIAGMVDKKEQRLYLVLGGRGTLSVHLSVFTKSADCVPDFGHLDIDDYGDTIRFGEYEVSMAFIFANKI